MPTKHGEIKVVLECTREEFPLQELIQAMGTIPAALIRPGTSNVYLFNDIGEDLIVGIQRFKELLRTETHVHMEWWIGEYDNIMFHIKFGDSFIVLTASLYAVSDRSTDICKALIGFLTPFAMRDRVTGILFALAGFEANPALRPGRWFDDPPITAD
ncbi:MAG TPA: hypothetical protein VFE24_18470 [Pirellulales bacterium]|jgi:hypothetical protein|nr:hypothetical protein [Pirellulales bacterium]